MCLAPVVHAGLAEETLETLCQHRTRLGARSPAAVCGALDLRSINRITREKLTTRVDDRRKTRCFEACEIDFKHLPVEERECLVERHEAAAICWE